MRELRLGATRMHTFLQLIDILDMDTGGPDADEEFGDLVYSKVRLLCLSFFIDLT